MKKYLLHFFVFFIAIAVTLCFSTSVFAKVEWNVINRIALEDNPLDIVISRDGATVYILCEKNILLYSLRENKVTDAIPVKGKSSQIALSPDGEKLLLTDTENRQVSIIKISEIYDIKVGQSPVIGKADAPVHVFAFFDFQ